MKRLFTFSLVALFAQMLLATTFEVDGFHYLVRDSINNTVELTFQEASPLNYASVTALNFPKEVSFEEKTYTVVAIGKAAFAYAKDLQDIEIPSFIEEIGPNAFYGCGALKKVKFNKGLKSIGRNAFVQSEVEEIVLPDGLQELGDLAFANCTNLKRLSLPKNIAHFGNNVFKDCTALEKILFDAPTSTMGNFTFSGCIAIQRVTLPSGLKHPSKGMFSKCANLEEVILGRDMVDLGDIAFEECTKLASIKAPAGSTFFSSNDDGVLLSADGSTLLYYPKGKTNEAYTIPTTISIIGNNAFADNHVLQQINIPNNVKVIKEEAFKGCNALKSLNIAEGLEVISARAFENCNKLTGITIPQSVQRIGKDAFKNTGDFNNKRNWKARLLYLGNCLIGQRDNQPKTGATVIRQGTRLIADQALERSAITELECPASLEYIGERAFYGCKKLATIKLPNAKGVAVAAFDSTAFYNNDKNWKGDALYIDKVLIQVSLETDAVFKVKNVIAIADEAFAGCKDIEEIKLPNSLLYIGKKAFQDCSNLTEINIPKKLVSIADDAFEGSQVSQEKIDEFTAATNGNEK